jgi:hypothetical protein
VGLRPVIELHELPGQVAVLLNIDKPLKKATLHNEFCSFVPKPHATKLKPEGRLGDDGGWFQVGSEEEAKRVAAAQWPVANFVRCAKC